MTKKEIADLLIKKQSINNISELHDLFCSDEDIKNNNVRAYSWDCKTCGAEDIRCDLNGLVQTGDDPEFISIKDNNFWNGCEQRNDTNCEKTRTNYPLPFNYGEGFVLSSTSSASKSIRSGVSCQETDIF